MTEAERECRIEAATDEDRWRREAEEERKTAATVVLSIECYDGDCSYCGDMECDCRCHELPF